MNSELEKRFKLLGLSNNVIDIIGTIDLQKAISLAKAGAYFDVIKKFSCYTQKLRWVKLKSEKMALEWIDRQGKTTFVDLSKIKNVIPINKKKSDTFQRGIRLVGAYSISYKYKLICNEDLDVWKHWIFAIVYIWSKAKHQALPQVNLCPVNAYYKIWVSNLEFSYAREDQVKNIISKLNISLFPDYIHYYFKKINVDLSGTIDLSEFMILLWKLLCGDELMKIFNCNTSMLFNNDIVYNFLKMKQYLSQENQQLCMEDLISMGSPFVEGNKITFQGLNHIIFSEKNSFKRTPKMLTKEENEQPITKFWIKYIDTPLKNNSSSLVDIMLGLTECLSLGYRALGFSIFYEDEVFMCSNEKIEDFNTQSKHDNESKKSINFKKVNNDFSYNNSKDDTAVYVKFSDVCSAISRCSFESDKYPVFLIFKTWEIICADEEYLNIMQLFLVELTKGLGKLLYIHKKDVDFPTLAGLKNKVAYGFKGPDYCRDEIDKMDHGGLFYQTLSEISETTDTLLVKDDNFDFKTKNYGNQYSDQKNSFSKNRLHDVSSNTSLKTKIEFSAYELSEKNFLIMDMPASVEIFNKIAHEYLFRGVQFINQAKNIDYSMISRSIFDNNIGYCLKPEFKFLMEKVNISVILGYNLIRPGILFDMTQRFSEKDNLNPQVKIYIFEINRAPVVYSSKIVYNDGFLPMFDFDVQIKIKNPYLSIIMFELRHVSESGFIILGKTASRICDLERGIRWVQLQSVLSSKKPVYPFGLLIKCTYIKLNYIGFEDIS